MCYATGELMTDDSIFVCFESILAFLSYTPLLLLFVLNITVRSVEKTVKNIKAMCILGSDICRCAYCFFIFCVDIHIDL